MDNCRHKAQGARRKEFRSLKFLILPCTLCPEPCAGGKRFYLPTYSLPRNAWYRTWWYCFFNAILGTAL